MLGTCVKTAISNVRVLKRVPNDSRVPLAERPRDKTNDILYNVEDVTKRIVSQMSLLFFFGAIEKKWTQTNHQHELYDKLTNFEQMPFHFSSPIPKFKAYLCAILFFRTDQKPARLK